MTDEHRTSLMGLAARSGIVRVKNVMNPLLWLVGITVPSLLGFSLLAGIDSYAGVASVCVAIGIIIISVLTYICFAVSNPDRLQSEEYNLRAMEMRLISKKKGEISDPFDLQPIALEPNEADGDRL